MQPEWCAVFAVLSLILLIVAVVWFSSPYKFAFGTVAIQVLVLSLAGCAVAAWSSQSSQA